MKSSKVKLTLFIIYMFVKYLVSIWDLMELGLDQNVNLMSLFNDKKRNCSFLEA